MFCLSLLILPDIVHLIQALSNKKKRRSTFTSLCGPVQAYLGSMTSDFLTHFKSHLSMTEILKAAVLQV